LARAIGIQVEVYGAKGTARFANETPTHYDLAIVNDNGPAPFTRMINRPSSPYVGALAAVPHDLVPIGYAESFGLMIHEFLLDRAKSTPSCLVPALPA
jgi:hypothetical protein